MRPPPRLQLFRGFLSLPLVRQATAASLPSRPLFLSSSFPLLLTTGSACINKCAQVSLLLSFSSTRFDFFISSLYLSIGLLFFSPYCLFRSSSFFGVFFLFSFLENWSLFQRALVKCANSVTIQCIMPIKNNSYFYEFFRIIRFNIGAHK